MSLESLSKSYEPEEIEKYWRQYWEDNKSFVADVENTAESYSIVIPPPNVTGALHIGHALNLTLIDVLCRHQRQLGKNVLWVPGTDHAGIATQNVVERELAKEGKTRHDLGREAFIERVWEWKHNYSGRILGQIRRLGASVDWSRERFTMDEDLAVAVRKVFVELYNEDLIYKGKYIINWCTRCHTALADDEVDHVEKQDQIWHVRYDLVDGSDSITIATTRPETIVADTAVCVHPEDERYIKLIGKKVYVPIIKREVTIIADRYVDQEFGTGALKVTPSHDHNDWELGHRHNLEFIQAIDDNGFMNENAGEYKGLSKEECRTRFVADLEAAGQLVKVEAISHSVGVCYRCKTTIDPHVSEQWFVRATKMAIPARAAVPDQTDIFPETWTKTYYNWLDNIRDWCISRQIWWGHRIPAWTCQDCQELIVSEHAPNICPKCNSTKLEQDPDVLDTWFSSALWPFTTMGYPKQTADLAKYYPTAVLVTGFDILFFWVARMMMMGIHFMKEVPFKEVYLHALVRDANGKKMSKSTGNVIDPIEMTDKYGTDALRFTLTSFAAMGRDIKLSEDRIDGYRHFINKLWNAARFSLMNLEETAPKAIDLSKVKALHHIWILHRLEETKLDNLSYAKDYRFNDLAQNLYRFLWNEFCDWYLELIKPDFKDDANPETKEETRYVLLTVLRELLILLHPIIPFVSSEIWKALPTEPQYNENLAKQLYPPMRPACLRPEEEMQMLFIQETISAIRTIRAELNINPSHKLNVIVKGANQTQVQTLNASSIWLTTLARLESFTLDAARPKDSSNAFVQGTEIIVNLEGAIDFAAELARLEKELAKVCKESDSLNARLANESFIAKAPANIVEAERQKAQELEQTKEKLKALHAKFSEGGA